MRASLFWGVPQDKSTSIMSPVMKDKTKSLSICDWILLDVVTLQQTDQFIFLLKRSFENQEKKNKVIGHQITVLQCHNIAMSIYITVSAYQYIDTSVYWTSLLWDMKDCFTANVVQTKTGAAGIC